MHSAGGGEAAAAAALFPRQKNGAPTSTDEFLKLVRDPFSSALAATAFWTSLGTSIAVTLVLGLFFSILRPHHHAVYAPRLKRLNQSGKPLPPVGSGLFSWLSPVLKTNEDQIVAAIGLDATVFLRFTRMCRNMFLAMSLVGCGILIPVNVTGAAKTLAKNQSGFTLMSPLIVFGKPLWAQVICAWLFDVMVAFFLWINYRAVQKLRRSYFESREYLGRLHSRTLLIIHIPKRYRSDEGVLELAGDIQSTARLPRSVIGRDVKGLSELHRQHERTVRQLESVLAKYLKRPDKLPSNRPKCKTAKDDDLYGKQVEVDAIHYLTDRMQRLEAKIMEARENIDKHRAMPYGFSSYDTAHEAHTVAYKARRYRRKGVEMRLAPPPEDIIWDNLPLSKSARRWKRLGNTAWVALLTVVWVVPNALIAIFLANLANLGKVWPAFQRAMWRNPRTWAAVQGIASPAVLSLVYLLLPILFRRLSMRAGDITKTSRERHVIRQLYAFFIFNNLVVFTSFSAIWQFIAVVVQSRQVHKDLMTAIRAGELGTKLLGALCTVSPFWVTWLLQRNLGAAVDLSQIFNLFWIWFAKTFMNPTPRQREEWLRPPPMDYASYYNYFLFYATVALCFATLQPIVLPVAALYFIIDGVLKKYLLMYVFYTKTESGGQFWRTVFNRMVFAAILANIVVALVVFARDERNMAICMVPPPLLMLAFKFYCRKTFDNEMHYFRRKLGDRESLPLPSKHALREENLAARFENPAFYKPLMAPMVYAEARVALTQVYQGRLHSESADDHATGVDGIRLRPLSSTIAAGAVAAGAAADMPFRFVPERLLEKEEAGGATSLSAGTAPPKTAASAAAEEEDWRLLRPEYGIDDDGGLGGRPVDLISERSRTPASTYHGGGFAPPSSQAAAAAARPPLPTNYDRYRAYAAAPASDGSASRPATADSAGDMTLYAASAANMPTYEHGNDSQSELLLRGR